LEAAVIEYTFKYGPFYFQVHAEDDRDAVRKGRRAIEESWPEDESAQRIDMHLKVDLTAGGFMGRLYVEPGEISINNIVKRQTVAEEQELVPF